jgi:hypothetical protein
MARGFGSRYAARNDLGKMMRRILTIVAMAALAIAATNCAKRGRATGPATGDGIPVDLNSADNTVAP